MTSDEFSVGWRDTVLAGSIAGPVDPPEPPPAVLLLQGSGPSERDADGYFEPIRRTFVEHGFAVAAFDKPGCGESSGDWREHALMARADQVRAVLTSLSERGDIDGSRIGVWGQSQGGWLAQIVAATANPAFAISNSGPSITVEAQNLFGFEHTLRTAGRSELEIDRALDHLHQVHDAARRGDDYDTVRAQLLAPAESEPWSEYFTVDDAVDWEFTVKLVQEAYDPIENLARVRCPYLAIFGGHDVLVPAWSGAQETGAALTACDDATVVVYPHGDHRIQIDGPLDFAPGYLDLLGDWAAARVRRAG